MENERYLNLKILHNLVHVHFAICKGTICQPGRIFDSGSVLCGASDLQDWQGCCSHSESANPCAKSDSVMPRGLTDHGANSAAAM
jgi:hypothetical protein